MEPKQITISKTGNKVLPTNPYVGTRDFYPEDMSIRNWFFSKMRNVVENFGYDEYNGPILESYDLYAVKSGEEIVNKQIYYFNDKSDRKLAIRPEMTPTVARMVASRLNQLTFPLRWYSMANLMRYERPQRGRLREHWQLNVDIFEVGTTLKADLEIISIIVDLLLSFGADASMFKIKLNNRKFFNDILSDILKVNNTDIKNISKAIDKRSKISIEEYNQWLISSGISRDKVDLLEVIFKSSFFDLWQMLKKEDSEGAKELQKLFDFLQDTDLEKYCEFDFSIVRGFDYYTGNVFEVYDTSPENKRSLFGGGRYNDLIGLFKDNTNITGIGFGFGDVTLQNFLEIHNLIPDNIVKNEKVLISRFDDVPYKEYIEVSKELRNQNIQNCIYLEDNIKLKKQLSYADKMKFPIVIILGMDEIKSNLIILKHMISGQQFTINRNEYIPKIKELLIVPII